VSLYSALYAGVSGLNAQSAAMATVADNITNVNTVGYKTVQADFMTLVGGGGGGGGDYAAGGVNAVAKQLVSKAGLLQAASSHSDMGIDGNGFFVVRDGTGANGKVAYTRAGSFSPDKQGFLKNTANYFLQGYPLDANGNYVNTGSLSDLQPVNIDALSGSAQPTTFVNQRINLQSTTTPVAAYAPGDMANGTVTPQFSRSVSVFDAQGTEHQVTFGFVKTAANTWQAEAYVTPKTDVTTPGNTGILVSGTVSFNPDGSLNVPGSSPALFAPITPAWTNGAGSQPITLGLGTDGGFDGLTQSSDASAQLSHDANGGLMGAVTDVNISDSGVVSAVFDDGSMRAIYQLPLATFANPNGLTAIQGNAYTVSSDSGNPLINAANTQGSGKIAAGQLEGSTADLGAEFTNMIRFQRAYSASSKIITTVDQMLQELSDIKR
jgi:flagellar hook protein FlgE